MTHHPPNSGLTRAEERSIRVSNIAGTLIVTAVLGGLIGLLLAKPDPLQLARFFEEETEARQETSPIFPTPTPAIVYLRMIYPILGTTLGAIVGAAYGGHVAKCKIDELRRERSEPGS
jgi:hypothetical protein